MKNIFTNIATIFVLILTITAAQTFAATFTVTKSTNSDDGVCDADCSLREAVFVADSGDTIVFNGNLIGQTFTLGGSEIVITRRITIDGTIDSVNVALISGSNTNRHFYIQAGGGLDLQNAILVQGNGAGLNQIDQRGGAINAADGASLALNRVAIRGNVGADFGGGINLGSGTHRIINSSFTGNLVNNGCAAIFNDDGNLYMANVTVSGNRETVNDGFGIGTVCNNGGDMFLRNLTIVNNTTDGSGGGIWNGALGDLNLGNTIIAQNTANTSGNDIHRVNGTITSVGGNLIGDLDTVPANTFNQLNDTTGVNPLVGPMNANQGGHPVATHPLQAGSPAINGGINANAVEPLSNTPLTTDARGIDFPRVAGGTVDKGAFEDLSLGSSLVVTKLANSNDNVCDTDCSLREAVFAASQDSGTDNITMAANVFGTMIVGTEIAIENHDVNIIGYPSISSNTLIVSGNDVSRVFRLSNASVTMTGFTVADGSGQGQSEPFGGGGLVAFGGNLTLNQMIFRNNSVSSIDGIRGGAIAAITVNVVRIMNSTINNNSAPETPGIELGNAVAYITNTTISSNTASFSNGVGTVSVGGSLYMRNSTVANNRNSNSTTGAGIYCGGSSTCNLGNNILSDNIAVTGNDMFVAPGGDIQSVGGNLVENLTGFDNSEFDQTNDILGVDPVLGALADNGGNVTTIALGAGSPAANRGINANATDPFSSAPLATDARGAGFTRIVGTVDKGAYERLAPSAASVWVSGRVMAGKGGLANVWVTATDMNGQTQSVRTSSFGEYRFDGLQAGQSYVLTVSAKQFQFGSHAVTLTDDLADLDFYAVE